MTPGGYLTDYVIRMTYPVLFTLYAVSDVTDKQYRQRLALLNGRNDVSLLDFLGVLRFVAPPSYLKLRPLV